MNPGYADFVFGLQALRRRVERDGPAIGGALGAAVRLLPHQVANVARVLTDLQIRHLVADEVGLGKTAQAIMVMNAVRLQRPDARIAIVVPNSLMAQWRDELRSRGHVAPVEGFTGEWDEHRPVLAWPQMLEETPIPFSDLDLLIVDEIQQLTKSLQDQIASAARDVESFLLLTATPPFHTAVDMQRILGMIEPQRVEGVSGEAFEALRQREARAWSALTDGDWAGLGGSPPDATQARSAAAAHCAARRIIRTRRAQWASYLPSRQANVVWVEPTAVERQRQRLMWSYFTYLGELSREFDIDLLAQRALRGPASLKQRVTYLKGHGHERGEILATVQDLLRPMHADSRFDALLDILSKVWAGEPRARVLIAAGDNLTVDDLAKRLPRFFDADGETRTVATIRNQSRGAEHLADEDEIASAAHQFQAGEVDVLLCAEVGNVGLNLQHTRHLVFYSIPWDPNDVEQWIGRVDRIGNPATQLPGGRHSAVEIHVPVLRGMVDERVFNVMLATGILERSVSLDKAAVVEAKAAIVGAALTDDPALWRSAMSRAEAVGRTAELEEMDLPLLADSPWNPQASAAFGEHAISSPPVGPVINGSPDEEAGRRAALEGWLSAMKRAGEYDLRRTQGARTLGYPEQMVHVRALSDAARVPLDQALIPWPRQPFAFYLSNRQRLEQPPATYKLNNKDQECPLYFLDHGSPLHEGLVEAWLGRLAATPRVRIVVPAEHPLHGPYRRHAVVVHVATADPADLLPVAPSVPRQLREADQRFLRSRLPPQLAVVAADVTTVRVLAMPAADLESLVAPTLDSPLWDAPCEAWSGTLPAGTEAQAATVVQREALRRLDDAWTPLLPAVREAIAERIYLIGADLGDREAAAERSMGAIRAAEVATGKRLAGRIKDVEDDVEAAREVAADRIAALGAVTRQLRSALKQRASALFFLT